MNLPEFEPIGRLASSQSLYRLRYRSSYLEAKFVGKLGRFGRSYLIPKTSLSSSNLSRDNVPTIFPVMQIKGAHNQEFAFAGVHYSTISTAPTGNIDSCSFPIT
jgi:hypothetical protein